MSSEVFRVSEVSLSPAVVMVGTPGFVRDPARLDDATLLRVLGENAGNLMFQYAASRIVAAPQIHVGLSETPYTETESLRSARALVFPAANHLRLGADWTGLNDYLEKAGLPLVILGLGAQAPTGEESATIAALRSDAHVRRMVDILRDRAVFVSVRGEFSARVCDALGLRDVHVLGCPSVFLNSDPQLGQKLQARIAALPDVPGRLRLAMTAAAPFEISAQAERCDLERRLFDWTKAAQGLYIQQSGGISVLRAARGQWHLLEPGPRKSIAAILAPQMDPVEVWAFLCRAARFPLSAPEWIAELAGCELVLGSRVHGNLAAIAAGVPGVIVAHDSRTAELAQCMHLPQLQAADVMATARPKDLAARIAFDGAAFDRWRAGAATTLTAAFDRLGIPVDPDIRALGGA